MKAGDKVFLARVVLDAVVVEEHEVTGSSLHQTCLRGSGWWSAHLLHATRTAALEALAERLEQEAQRERTVASEHITRAERCLVQAERARRMVGEGGK